jgi:hypothetical protein
MFKPILAGIGAAVLLASTPVFAESASKPGASTEGQSGTTSGPAAGKPATLGSGGSSPATPHQQQGVKDQSSSVKDKDDTGVSGSSQKPSASGSSASESAAKDSSGKSN